MAENQGSDVIKYTSTTGISGDIELIGSECPLLRDTQ